MEGAQVVITEVPLVPLLLNDEARDTASVGTAFDEAVDEDGGKSVLLADD